MPTVGLLLLEQILPRATQGGLQAQERRRQGVHLCRLDPLKRADVQVHGFRVSSEPRIVTCTSEAEKTFDACHNAIVDRDESGDLPEPLQPFASRVAEQAKESQAERLESKLRANGGRMTMRELKRAGYEEATIRRLIRENPFRLHLVTVKPEGGGRESEVVALA